MLAKELKIKALLSQRDYIKQRLENSLYEEECSICFVYVGEVFSENIKYFENEGFAVTKLSSGNFELLYGGIPAYLFSVDDIQLSTEELLQADLFYNEGLVFEESDELEEDDELDDPSNLIFVKKTTYSN